MLILVYVFIITVLLLLGVRSDAGVHDRVVIQELLKEVAQNQVLEASHKSFKGTPKNLTLPCDICAKNTGNFLGQFFSS